VLRSAAKISGSAAVGKILNLNSGTWSANPMPTTTQQWYRCENLVPVSTSVFTDTQNCEKIRGANKAQYKITDADKGTHLTALVSGKNSQGVVGKSAKSIKVPGIKPVLETSPRISGATNLGSRLRATDGTWSAIPEATTSLTWYRCANSVRAGATSITGSMRCTRIPGATGSTRSVVEADQGKYLTVLVTARNSEGTASSTAASVFVKAPVVTP
jgi:hypothetical protein